MAGGAVKPARLARRGSGVVAVLPGYTCPAATAASCACLKVKSSGKSMMSMHGGVCLARGDKEEGPS